MNAVATSPKARAAKPRTPTTPAPASAAGLPGNYTHLFSTAANLLEQAWLTDEPHNYSGESDRLLSIAAGLAAAAPVDETVQDGQSRAFDIAACLNAARLVPGDVESKARTTLINQVAAILGEITEAQDCVRTNVPRPLLQGHASESAVASTPRLTSSEVSALHFQSMCHFSCAKSVLDLYAEHAGNALFYGMRDLLNHYYCQAQGQEETEPPGDFFSGILPDLSCSLENLMEVIGHANVAGDMDDGILHAVEYLLRNAKEIADGERYQAKEVHA